jgi:hypothetical protein
MKSGAYDTDSLIEFLTEFHRHFAGEKVTLIWDRWPSHRSKEMKAWIAKQRRWLVVEQLPAYPLTSTPWSCCGATSKVSNSPTCAPRRSRKHGRPPRQACDAPAPTTNCASTSFNTLVFLCDHAVKVLSKSL